MSKTNTELLHVIANDPAITGALFTLDLEIDEEAQEMAAGLPRAAELQCFGHDGAHNFFALWTKHGAPDAAPVVWVDVHSTDEPLIVAASVAELLALACVLDACSSRWIDTVSKLRGLPVASKDAPGLADDDVTLAIRRADSPEAATEVLFTYLRGKLPWSRGKRAALAAALAPLGIVPCPNPWATVEAARSRYSSPRPSVEPLGDADRVHVVAIDGARVTLDLELGQRVLPKEAPFFVLLLRDAMDTLGVDGPLRDAMPKLPIVAYEEDPALARRDAAKYVTKVTRTSLDDGTIESEQPAFSVLAESPPGVVPRARFELEATDPKWVSHLRPGAVARVQVYFAG